MIIDCRKQTSSQNYFTLTQSVIPRPIAWVLSDNGHGSYNLAPFSFFNVVASDPPLIMLSVGWKDEATRKDTWVNISRRRHFVAHIPTTDDQKNVVGSAATLRHGDSEVDTLQIPLVKVSGQKLPRVQGPRIAFFCERYSIDEIGKDRQGLILGQVRQIWLDDAIVRSHNGRLQIDAGKVDPLARLGADQYASLGRILAMKRPD